MELADLLQQLEQQEEGWLVLDSPDAAERFIQEMQEKIIIRAIKYRHWTKSIEKKWLRRGEAGEIRFLYCSPTDTQLTGGLIEMEGWGSREISAGNKDYLVLGDTVKFFQIKDGAYGVMIHYLDPQKGHPRQLEHYAAEAIIPSV